MKPDPSYSSDGSHLKVDAGYWERLQRRDPLLLCNRTQFEPDPNGGLKFRFLGEDVLVAPAERCLKRRDSGEWARTDDPLLELATVLYLLWEGDDEFAPRLSVLFDRSIENILAADAIWGIVTRVSKALADVA